MNENRKQSQCISQQKRIARCSHCTNGEIAMDREETIDLFRYRLQKNISRAIEYTLDSVDNFEVLDDKFFRDYESNLLDDFEDVLSEFQ